MYNVFLQGSRAWWTDQTEDKRPFRMLTVIDEVTRRCLAIVVARRLRSDDVLRCPIS